MSAEDAGSPGEAGAKRPDASAEASPPAKRMKSTRSDKATAAVIEKAFDEVFGPLGLDDITRKENIGKTRPRNHVNPLSSKFQAPIEEPKWADLYADVSKPLWVDIGCAQGRFGLQMAAHERWSGHNHLGLEIRNPHVTRANVWAKGKGLTNLHYLCCNANTSLEVILKSYPGEVAYVAVQFPDPQFKKKHHKRRVVNAAFVSMLAANLREGARFFVQSDVEEAAAQMRDRTDRSPFFDREGEYSPRDAALDPAVVADGSDDSVWTKDGKRALPLADGAAAVDHPDYGDWLQGPNPIGVVTEREVQNTALNLPIYRTMFVRNAKPFSADGEAAAAGAPATEGSAN